MQIKNAIKIRRRHFFEHFIKIKSLSENIKIMVKKVFPEVTQRLFYRVFVCRVCKHKMRADPAKVREGKVKCRYCGSRALRPKRRPMV